MKRSISGRSFALVIALILVCQNAVLADLSQANIWTDRRRPLHTVVPEDLEPLPARLIQTPAAGHAFTLAKARKPGRTQNAPPLDRPRPSRVTRLARFPNDGSAGLDQLIGDILPYATVREAHIERNPSAPLIVCMQDIHEVEEAQANLAQSIIKLHESESVDLVGLEGAVGALHLAPYRAYQDQRVNKASAEVLLRLGYLGAAEFAGIVAKQELPLFGIEAPDLYAANISAYREAFNKTEWLQTWLANERRLLNANRTGDVSLAVRSFDERRRAYLEEREGLAEYAKYLLSQKEKSPPGSRKERGKSYYALQNLVDLLDVEKALDFERVESERREFADALAGKLDAATLKDVIAHGFDLESGSLSAAEYGSYLKSLCARAGIELAKWPALQRYMDYSARARDVDVTAVLADLDEVEQLLGTALAVTPQEKQFLEISEFFGLLEKLAKFQLTPQQWERYVAVRSNVRPALDEASTSTSNETWTTVESFERFYQHAKERDQTMARNLLKELKRRKAGRAVMLAGGFHTDGITRVFRENRISYVTVQPKLSALPDDKNYLDIFVRDPLPLEKLFAGEAVNLISPRLTAAPGSALYQAIPDAAATTSRKSTCELLFSSLQLTVAQTLSKGPLSADRRNKLEQLASSFDNVARITSESTGGASSVKITSFKARLRNGRRPRYTIACIAKEELQRNPDALKDAEIDSPLVQTELTIDGTPTIVTVSAENEFGFAGTADDFMDSIAALHQGKVVDLIPLVINACKNVGGLDLAVNFLTARIQNEGFDAGMALLVKKYFEIAANGDAADVVSFKLVHLHVVLRSLIEGYLKAIFERASSSWFARADAVEARLEELFNRNSERLRALGLNEVDVVPYPDETAGGLIQSPDLFILAPFIPRRRNNQKRGNRATLFVNQRLLFALAGLGLHNAAKDGKPKFEAAAEITAQGDTWVISKELDDFLVRIVDRELELRDRMRHQPFDAAHEAISQHKPQAELEFWARFLVNPNTREKFMKKAHIFHHDLLPNTATPLTNGLGIVRIAFKTESADDEVLKSLEKAIGHFKAEGDRFLAALGNLRGNDFDQLPDEEFYGKCGAVAASMLRIQEAINNPALDLGIDRVRQYGGPFAIPASGQMERTLKNSRRQIHSFHKYLRDGNYIGDPKDVLLDELKQEISGEIDTASFGALNETSFGPWVRVKMDLDHWSRVWINFLSNTKKVGSRNAGIDVQVVGARLVIKYWDEAGEGKEGIPKDLLLFNPLTGRQTIFDMGTTTEVENKGQHGTGMATVYDIVEGAGGRITAGNYVAEKKKIVTTFESATQEQVETEVKETVKGAEFTIELPLDTDHLFNSMGWSDQQRVEKADKLLREVGTGFTWRRAKKGPKDSTFVHGEWSDRGLAAFVAAARRRYQEALTNDGLYDPESPFVYHARNRGAQGFEPGPGDIFSYLLYMLSVEPATDEPREPFPFTEPIYGQIEKLAEMAQAIPSDETATEGDLRNRIDLSIRALELVEQFTVFLVRRFGSVNWFKEVQIFNAEPKLSRATKQEMNLTDSMAALSVSLAVAMAAKTFDLANPFVSQTLTALTIVFALLFVLIAILVIAKRFSSTESTGPPAMLLFGLRAVPSQSAHFVQFDKFGRQYEVNPILYRLLNSNNFFARLLGQAILLFAQAALHEPTHAAKRLQFSGDGLLRWVGNEAIGFGLAQVLPVVAGTLIGGVWGGLISVFVLALIVQLVFRYRDARSVNPLERTLVGGPAQPAMTLNRHKMNAEAVRDRAMRSREEAATARAALNELVRDPAGEDFAGRLRDFQETGDFAALKGSASKSNLQSSLRAETVRQLNGSGFDLIGRARHVGTALAIVHATGGTLLQRQSQRKLLGLVGPLRRFETATQQRAEIELMSVLITQLDAFNFLLDSPASLAPRLVEELREAYNRAMKLVSAEQRIRENLQSGRAMAFEVSADLLNRRMREDDLNEMDQECLQNIRLAARLAGELTDGPQPFILIVPKATLESGAASIYYRVPELKDFALRPVRKAAALVGPDRYSVEKLTELAQKKGQQLDLLVLRPQEWDMEGSLKGLVRLFVSLTGGLLYDASDQIHSDITALLYIEQQT